MEILSNSKTFKGIKKVSSAKSVVLNSRNWGPLNFNLVKNIGYKSALFLTFLLHQEDFWIANDNIQSDGSFYVTQDTIKEWLGMGVEAQTTALKKLEFLGIISTKNRSTPNTFRYVKYIKINKEKLKLYL